MNKTIICLLTLCSLLSSRTVSAGTQEYISTSSCDLPQEQALLTQNDFKLINNNYVASQKTLSLASLNLPSLWWARQQFDPFGGRLINNWLAYPEIKQIQLTVNWQLWTLLDYLGRYRFVNQFGTVARRYGYELHIFNNQQQCLASYQYNRESSPPKWEISLEQSEQDSLQIQPNN